MDILFYRKVLIGSWTKILANSDSADADSPEIAQRLNYLRARLAKPEHNAGLGVDCRVHVRYRLKQIQCALVPGLRPDGWREPLHRLDVVIVDIGVSINHQLNAPALPFEVGSEH